LTPSQDNIFDLYGKNPRTQLGFCLHLPEGYWKAIWSFIMLFTNGFQIDPTVKGCAIHVLSPHALVIQRVVNQFLDNPLKYERQVEGVMVRTGISLYDIQDVLERFSSFVAGSDGFFIEPVDMKTYNDSNQGLRNRGTDESEANQETG